MIQLVNRANEYAAKALEVMVAVVLSSMVALVFANVVGRYAFGRAITWADEVARFAFVWLTFMGTALAVRRGAHIGMDILTSQVSERTRVVLRIVGFVLVIAFLVVWARWGFRMAYLNRRFIGSGSGIPLSYVYGVAPVMALLMVSQHLVMLAESIRDLLRR